MINKYYKHYKGNIYKVLLTDVMNSENLDLMIVYQDVKDLAVWVRTLDEFIETIEINGKNIKRFEEIHYTERAV
jgi:hypothetical protein